MDNGQSKPKIASAALKPALRLNRQILPIPLAPSTGHAVSSAIVLTAAEAPEEKAEAFALKSALCTRSFSLSHGLLANPVQASQTILTNSHLVKDRQLCCRMLHWNYLRSNADYWSRLVKASQASLNRRPGQKSGKSRFSHFLCACAPKKISISQPPFIRYDTNQKS